MAKFVLVSRRDLILVVKGWVLAPVKKSAMSESLLVEFAEGLCVFLSSNQIYVRCSCAGDISSS